MSAVLIIKDQRINFDRVLQIRTNTEVPTDHELHPLANIGACEITLVVDSIRTKTNTARDRLILPTKAMCRILNHCKASKEYKFVVWRHHPLFGIPDLIYETPVNAKEMKKEIVEAKLSDKGHIIFETLLPPLLFPAFFICIAERDKDFQSLYGKLKGISEWVDGLGALGSEKFIRFVTDASGLHLELELFDSQVPGSFLASSFKIGDSGVSPQARTVTFSVDPRRNSVSIHGHYKNNTWAEGVNRHVNYMGLNTGLIYRYLIEKVAVLGGSEKDPLDSQFCSLLVWQYDPKTAQVFMRNKFKFESLREIAQAFDIGPTSDSALTNYIKLFFKGILNLSVGLCDYEGPVIPHQYLFQNKLDLRFFLFRARKLI